jgi:hypothetical protein
VAGLLADREFVGGRWFAYLKAQGLPPCIRIWANTRPGSRDWFRSPRVGEARAFKGKPWVLERPCMTLRGFPSLILVRVGASTPDELLSGLYLSFVGGVRLRCLRPTLVKGHGPLTRSMCRYGLEPAEAPPGRGSPQGSPWGLTKALPSPSRLDLAQLLMGT